MADQALSMNANEILKAIYGEDCEFVRYHDGLMWSRFQTVAAIEAAILYGRYQVNALTLPEKAVLLSVGTILVFLCCLLAFRNREVSQVHLNRVKRIEQEAANSQTILQFGYRKPLFQSADVFLWSVTLLLTVPNIVLIVKLVCAQLNSSPHSSLGIWRF